MPPKSLIPILLIAVLLITDCGGQKRVERSTSDIDSMSAKRSVRYLTKDEIIKIAYNEAKRLQYDTHGKRFRIWDNPVTLDSLEYLGPKNIPNNWDTTKYGKPIEFWYKIYFGEGLLNPKDFENKRFWVISFDNYEITIGGGLSIFIDADNGKILYSALRK